MTRATIISAFCALCVVVTGCDRWETVTCLPQDRGKVEPVVERGAADSRDKPAPPAQLEVYLDATGSVRGFILQEQSEAEPIYSRLIREMVDLPSVEPAIQQVSAHKFGVWTEQIEWDKLDQARDDETFYTESAGGFNQKSRLDKVLVEIDKALTNGSDETLWAVGTDLVLTDKKDVGRNSRVSGPLVKMLHRGLSVGILAVKSRFKGLIYDLPFEKGMKKYDHDGYLGYYLLMIGKHDHVRYLQDYLRRKLEGYEPRDYHFQIFSQNQLFEAVTVDALKSADSVQLNGANASAEPLIAIDTPQRIEFEFDRNIREVAVRFRVSDLVPNSSSLAPRLEIRTSDWFVIAPKGTCKER